MKVFQEARSQSQSFFLLKKAHELLLVSQRKKKVESLGIVSF